jgi:hypothetical protein
MRLSLLLARLSPRWHRADASWAWRSRSPKVSLQHYDRRICRDILIRIKS